MGPEVNPPSWPSVRRPTSLSVQEDRRIVPGPGMATPARAFTVVFTAFIASAVFALMTSICIVEERLSSGSPTVALVGNGVVTFGAIFVLALTNRGEPLLARTIAPQVLGAVCGIALVHLALRLGIVAAPSWLSERPAQFVNDAVAVGATLAVVWACARRFDLRLLLGALLLVTAYRVTSRSWHLDHAPHGFFLGVQDLVIAQFIAAVLALTVYRGMTGAAD